MRGKVVIVGAVLGALALAGCNATDGKDFAGNSVKAGSSSSASSAPSKSAEPAGPKTFAMGETGTVSDSDGDKLKVTVANPHDVAGNEFLKPQNGRFLVVDVTFEAIRTADVNPFDFVLLTSDGQRLQPGVGPEDSGTLHSATLNTGEKIKGTITFDAPTTGVEAVAYAPLDQVLGKWTLVG